MSCLGRLGKAPGGRHAQGARLGSIFGSPWGPQVDFCLALGAQEGAKSEPKDDQKAVLKSMQKALACYNGLKTDLGRSWADVGAILGSQEGENRALA